MNCVLLGAHVRRRNDRKIMHAKSNIRMWSTQSMHFPSNKQRPALGTDCTPHTASHCHDRSLQKYSLRGAESFLSS